MYLVQRPRRLRQTPAVRRLVAETRLHPADLVLPMFVVEGLDEPRPITAMPGVVQHSLSSLAEAAVEAQAGGIGHGGLREKQMIDAKLEHADFWRNPSVIPDKLRSSADPGSIVKLRRPPMDPGSSPG